MIFNILVIVVVSVRFVASETDRLCQTYPENFTCGNILKKPTNDFSSTPSNIETSTKLFERNTDRYNSSRKDFWNTFLDLPRSACSKDRAWNLQEIVTNLQHCGWKTSVVIVSDLTLDRNSVSSQSADSFPLKGPTPHYNHSSIWPSSTKAIGSPPSIEIPLIVQSLLEAFHVWLIPVQHFQLSSINDEDLQGQLKEIVWTAYNSTRTMNFLYISQKPWEIVHAAQTIFKRYHRGRGALMPHRTHFALIGVVPNFTSHTASSTKSSSWPSLSSYDLHMSALLKETETQLAYSEFDNVLFTQYIHKHDESEYLKVFDIHFFKAPQTLMWRKNRKREFEAVSSLSICDYFFSFSQPRETEQNKNRRCELFPNIDNGMNGRNLKFLTKEWAAFITAEDHGDSLKYVGLIPEIAQTLSMSMNFSYSFVPSILESRLVSWPGLRKMMVTEGVGDCLFSLYYISSSLTYNYSQSYPIFAINMTGAHISKPQAKILLFMSRLDPKVYLILVVSFVLVLLYFACLSTLNKKWSSKGITRRASSNEHFWEKYFYECWKVLFDLYGSWFSQSITLQPRFLSGRILIFCWCITILILTATFKGDLASSLVKTNPSPPFKTFSELVDRADYRWGHHNNSTFLDVMQVDKDSTLSKLYSGLVHFVKKDPDVLPPSFNDLMAKVAIDEKFVAIIDSFNLQISLSSLGIQHVKVIPDSLGINGLAPAFPRDSELTDLVSEHTIALSDSGVFKLLVDNLSRRLMAAATANLSESVQNSSSMNSEDGRQKESNRIDVFTGLSVSVILVIFAVVVLWIELLFPVLVKKLNL